MPVRDFLEFLDCLTILLTTPTIYPGWGKTWTNKSWSIQVCNEENQGTNFVEYSPSYGSKKDACFRTLRDLAGSKGVMSTLCVLPSNISCASASPVAGPLLRIGDKGDRIKVQDLVVLKIWAPAEFPNKSDQQPCIDRRLQAPPQCKDHRPCHHKEFFESYICRDILCGGEIISQTFFCTIMNILTKLRTNTQ